MLIQRGDNEIHETDPEKDDKGIAALNEALKNGSNIGYEDQCLAESIEVCGIGHRMIDVKLSEIRSRFQKILSAGYQSLNMRDHLIGPAALNGRYQEWMH